MPAVNHPTDVRVIDMHVPGPAHRSVAPEPLRELALRATVDRPNRLGSSDVPVRLYEPVLAPTSSLIKPVSEPWATLVWAHGGSFIQGSLEWPESDWVARACARRGVRVIAVDYGLATETVKAPAPANDVAAVLRWVESRYGGRILVGGASAGGHLAADAALIQAAAAHAGVAGPAAGLLLVYPTLHRVQRAHPELDAAAAKLPRVKQFSAERIREMYAFYLDDESNAPDTPWELPDSIAAGVSPAQPSVDLAPGRVTDRGVDPWARAAAAPESAPDGGLAGDAPQDDAPPADTAPADESASDPYAPLPISATAGLARDVSAMEADASPATDGSTPPASGAAPLTTDTAATAAQGAAQASLSAITALIEQIRAARQPVAEQPLEPSEPVSEYPLRPVVVGELGPRQLSRLPATVIVNAEVDQLRTSAEQFAEQVEAAGVPVRLHLEPGTVHGYLNSPESSAEATAAAERTIDTLLTSLRELLDA